MTTSHTLTERASSYAILTDGVGNSSSHHLNLSRSLADVWQMKPGTPPWSERDKESIRAYVAAGETLTEIAARSKTAFKLTPEHIRDFCLECGIDPPPLDREPPTVAPDPTPKPRKPYKRQPDPRPAYAGKEKANLRLRDWQGAYLHMSGQGMTRDKNNAWIGTQTQLDRLRSSQPETRELIASEVVA